MNSILNRAVTFSLLHLRSFLTLVFSAILVVGSVGVFAYVPQEACQERIHPSKSTTERVTGVRFHPTRLLMRHKTGRPATAKQAIPEAASARVLRKFSVVKQLQLGQIAERSSAHGEHIMHVGVLGQQHLRITSESIGSSGNGVPMATPRIMGVTR